MKKISAVIVADSKNVQGDRITTYELTFPRFILAELLTHRLFSRNSASSRAIPFKTMLKMVEEDPFIPIAWQKDHKGMQGTSYFTKEEIRSKGLEHGWLMARDMSVTWARQLNESGVTKQICNRLLEPFLWHKVLVTATEYDNFFELRCPKYNPGEIGLLATFKSRKEAVKYYGGDLRVLRKPIRDLNDLDWLNINEGQGEIHIMALAEAMWDARNESTPQKLEAGEWHIPFGDSFDDFRVREAVMKPLKEGNYNDDWLFDQYDLAKIKIATARCARISYNNFEGKDDYEADIKLYDRLKESGHFSPFEHCARAMTQAEYLANVKGHMAVDSEYGELFMHGTHVEDVDYDEDNHGWCLNFKGFIQLRAITLNTER